MIIKRLVNAAANPSIAVEAVGRRLRQLKWSWRDVSNAAMALEARDPGTALDLHRAIHRVSPNDHLLQYRLGAFEASLGGFDQALGLLEKAVIGRPESSSYREKLARVAFHLMGPERAVKCLLSLPKASHGATFASHRVAAAELLRHKQLDLAAQHFSRAFGETCSGLYAADDVSGVYSVVLRFEAGKYAIGFTRDFLYWPFLIDRLLTYAPLLDRLCREDAPTGVVRFSIGDGPDGPDRQLCFSGKTVDDILIPDSHFLESSGYLSYRRQVRDHAIGWADRADDLYWRGSLTGVADQYADMMRLPRVTLSLMALHVPRLNAKITDLSQFGPWLPNLQFMLDGLGVLGPREDAIENVRYKYLVDIDGNTNSWPGLFMKLASGGMVFKLSSEYRQWYYDRLIPDENHVLIDTLDALPELAERYAANSRRAEAIGRAGARLANSMTPRSEYRHLASAVQKAIV